MLFTTVPVRPSCEPPRSTAASTGPSPTSPTSPWGRRRSTGRPRRRCRRAGTRGPTSLTVDLPGVPEEALSVSVAGRTARPRRRHRRPHVERADPPAADARRRRDDCRTTPTVDSPSRFQRHPRPQPRRSRSPSARRPRPNSTPAAISPSTARPTTPSDEAGPPAPSSPAGDLVAEGRPASPPVNPAPPHRRPPPGGRRPRTGSRRDRHRRCRRSRPECRRPDGRRQCTASRCLRPRRGTGGCGGLHRKPSHQRRVCSSRQRRRRSGARRLSGCAGDVRGRGRGHRSDDASQRLTCRDVAVNDREGFAVVGPTPTSRRPPTVGRRRRRLGTPRARGPRR